MLSVPHLIVIFIVALVVFGPEKIPELARNLGKIMAEFRRVTGDLRSTFEGHLRDLEREADQRRSTAPPAAALPAVPAVTTVPAADAGAVAPGTVPSNPPNAGAVNNPAPPGPDPAPRANSSVAYTQPGDAMHDPYLMSMDFPEHESEPANGIKPAEPTHESERVTDGDGRNS